jgi:hypothetical protein
LGAVWERRPLKGRCITVPPCNEEHDPQTAAAASTTAIAKFGYSQ